MGGIKPQGQVDRFNQLLATGEWGPNDHIQAAQMLADSVPIFQKWKRNGVDKVVLAWMERDLASRGPSLFYWVKIGKPWEPLKAPRAEGDEAQMPDRLTILEAAQAAIADGEMRTTREWADVFSALSKLAEPLIKGKRNAKMLANYVGNGSTQIAQAERDNMPMGEDVGDGR